MLKEGTFFLICNVLARVHPKDVVINEIMLQDNKPLVTIGDAKHCAMIYLYNTQMSHLGST